MAFREARIIKEINGNKLLQLQIFHGMMWSTFFIIFSKIMINCCIIFLIVKILGYEEFEKSLKHH
jgi:hypothetical protein